MHALGRCTQAQTENIPKIFWFPQAAGTGCAAVSHYYRAQGVSMATPSLDFTAAFSSTLTLSVRLSLPRTHANQTSLLSPLNSPLSSQITPLLFLPPTAENSEWLFLGTQQKRGQRFRSKLPPKCQRSHSSLPNLQPYSQQRWSWPRLLEISRVPHGGTEPRAGRPLSCSQKSGELAC